MTPTANTATKPVVSNPALPTVIARPPYQSSGVRRVSLNRGSGGNQAATVEQPHVRVITATSASLSTLCSPRDGEVERGQKVGRTTSVATEGLGCPDESEVSASGLARRVARQTDLRVLERFHSRSLVSRVAVISAVCPPWRLPSNRIALRDGEPTGKTS